jgi:tetratricopeptide (TPR) repeat protein
LTAEAEHAVIQAAHTRPSTARPSTSQSTDISNFIPKLLEAIEAERTYVEDDFQAQVCLGWIHWQLGQFELAAGRLPGSVEQEFSQLDGTNNESVEWTKVCAIKGSYLKGTSLFRVGKESEALVLFESALPILATYSTSKGQSKEFKAWAELYLTEFCMLSSRLIKSQSTAILETETLSAFRTWAKFWDGHTGSIGGRAPLADVPRRNIWKEYYRTLSDILYQDAPFPITSMVTTHTTISTRHEQRAELKRVETKYETLLLSEVQFPKAEDPGEEVEAFVVLVMRNWSILCGNSWAEHDLGEGGSDVLSRGVIDILYRAATKTFHSTSILRHLFTVHQALAEFDLAFKAFDTYLDIVKRSRARVEKTGQAEFGLDDDETVLITMSECIKSLCRYGLREGAEKAKELAQFFEAWLEKYYPVDQENGNGSSLEAAKPVAPNIFALAWRCIGIGYANWSRLTFDGSARTEIQQHAIACFKKSLLPAYESTSNVATLYALGTILAERREIPVALQIVKSALQRPNVSSTKSNSDLETNTERFTKERLLIPLWHLMALLLSARQEFKTAARSCEGAFEQFQDPKILFGNADLHGSYRSDHLQMNEKPMTRSPGIVDDMDESEKEGVLEVKMTQLCLVEIIEGPDVAVNASDELFSLYARLFGKKDTVVPLAANDSLMSLPPKSSAGTLRSIKGSIFGRSGRSIRKSQIAPLGDRSALPRPQTTQTMNSTRAPVIQVTSENGNTAKQHNHLTKPHRRSGSLSRLDAAGSLRNRSTSTTRRHARSSVTIENSPVTHDGEKYYTPEESTSIVQNGSQSHDSSASASMPTTRLSKDQQRRRRTSMLVKVWLLIAGFYRRAAMYEDCRGAIEEADKLVTSLDTDVSRDISGNVSITKAGWGGGKSVAELWGDVFSEVRFRLQKICIY